MTPFKIIFIHGYTSSSKADWYPELSQELKKLEVDFAVPDLPGGEHPHAQEWLHAVHEEIKNTDKPTCISWPQFRYEGSVTLYRKVSAKSRKGISYCCFC